MGDGTGRYRLASDEVVSDVIDGETVLVNLATGSYYTANPTGGVIWSLATGGRTRDEVIRELSRRFTEDGTRVAPACAAFLDRLCSEGLLAEADAGAPQGAAPAEPAGARAPFVEPVLTRYTDMEDLLSLDPIHEVDELGWPHVKPPGAE